MQSENTAVDLGDELLTRIIELVRGSDFTVSRKAASLVRAGKIGEMYLGALADETGDVALTCRPSALAE